jgi:hypothetical protein
MFVDECITLVWELMDMDYGLITIVLMWFCRLISRTSKKGGVRSGMMG